MSQWKTPSLKKLAQTLTDIDSEDLMMRFLRDLCTLEELSVLSVRWKAVKLLEKGISYRDISKQTGLSTTTIGRISHWLQHGENGYKDALSLKKT